MAMKRKVGECAKIARVFNAAGEHVGNIETIQRKKYWSWLPFGYYFQLCFSSCSPELPVFIGWFDGAEDGERKLKGMLERYVPNYRLSPIE